MAIGRISIKSGSKGKGLPHAKYIMREDKYAKRADKLEKLESVGHGNMPSWAKDNPKTLWEMADEHERKNGSVYREHIISLPREMNESQRLELVQDWIKQEIGNKHPYSYAIHNPLAMDGKEQPHCHLMICERTLDGIDRGADQFFKRYNSKNPTKGGAKKANTGLDHTTRKEQIKQQRDRWEKMCNKHLERIGSRERVSLKNYKERGVEQPQNISMTDMLKPEIKQAYKDKLHARAELKTALFERIKTVGMTSKALADIEQRQKTTLPQEVKKQSEVTAVTEQKPQPITETHSKPIEPLQKIKMIDTTTPPPKSLETSNKPQNEPNLSDIDKKQNLIKDYAKKVQTTAKAILDSQLKALREKSKPILEKYNTLKDSKPLMFGKDKWEQDTNNALKQYNAIKTTHDNLKDKGVTDDHYKQAREHIAKNEPSYHAQVQQAIKDLESHKQAENAKFAREHGADKLATNGEYYSGKILKITEKGAYQQTKQHGIVLHPVYANDRDLKLDKSYDFNYTEVERTGKILRSETYEVRLSSKDPNQERNTDISH